MKIKEHCTHLKAVTDIKIGTEDVCEECIKNNGTWVHLRTCQKCGVTLCCDSSPAQHATKHYLETGHPVIASATPDQRWLWCYVDKQYRKY